jgi:hypothetical protein
MNEIDLPARFVRARLPGHTYHGTLWKMLNFTAKARSKAITTAQASSENHAPRPSELRLDVSVAIEKSP